MPISQKQKQIMAFPYTNFDCIICDGAIRSGKTVFMTIAFIDDAMRRFNHQRFGICGKTVDSCVKNIIAPYVALSYAKEKYTIRWKRTDKLLVISNGKHENIFEVFGGKDESSFMLIQGRTLAGVLLDEVALQPKSFVEQALARCSVEGSRFWFNCNPDVPQHWFYLNWILNAKEHNALHLHFELEDNPSLSEKIISRYKSMYTGVFYRRYILGEWCVAEGLVYDFGEENITDEVPESGEYYLSIDYGTMNPFSCGLWCVLGGKAVRIKEYYYSGRETQRMKTDEEYADEVDKLAKGYKITRVIIDPSAASFIAVLRKRGYIVQKANNDVLDGIRRTSVYLKSGKILIHRNCVDAIREFGLYRWDEKSTEDKVIKENDHCLVGDTLVNTIFGAKKIKDLVGKIGLVWSYDEKQKRKCLKPFFRVRKTQINQPILKITLGNGKTVKCTPNHRILTENGWKEARELTTDDRIMDVLN